MLNYFNCIKNDNLNKKQINMQILETCIDRVKLLMPLTYNILQTFKSKDRNLSNKYCNHV